VRAAVPVSSYTIIKQRSCLPERRYLPAPAGRAFGLGEDCSDNSVSSLWAASQSSRSRPSSQPRSRYSSYARFSICLVVGNLGWLICPSMISLVSTCISTYSFPLRPASAASSLRAASKPETEPHHKTSPLGIFSNRSYVRFMVWLDARHSAEATPTGGITLGGLLREERAAHKFDVAVNAR
jgi:hypothetical protein